jgi:hypothetical protein
MLELWILIFFFIFLIIYNSIAIIEGFAPGENAHNAWKTPPIGVQPDREDVPPPPLKPPRDKKVQIIKPGVVMPLKPTCECFDSQTKIFLQQNSLTYKQLKEDIKVLKRKVQLASKKIGENYDIIQQNKDFDTDICCATGSKDCPILNGYDCVGASLEKTIGAKTK